MVLDSESNGICPKSRCRLNGVAGDSAPLAPSWGGWGAALRSIASYGDRLGEPTLISVSWWPYFMVVGKEVLNV